jgi:hypothetical protein
MGKTSLMNRILNHAKQQGCRTALINFWNREFLTNINTFLPWFCTNITEELKLEDKLDQYWKKRLGSQINCANYLTKYILPAMDNPLVIALDDVDKIFTYTEVAQDFFGLLRAWHERGNYDKIWQKFRLIISHSQEVYLKLKMKVHQSPFNVGLSIELSEFNLTQVKDLIQRHQLIFSEAEIKDLMAMVNGHPYLLRTALYQIAKKQLTLAEFLKVAPTEEGLFGDFLYSYLLLLENDKALKIAMEQAIKSEQPVKVEPTQAFKLRSMGLVESTGNEIKPLCNLYRLYFQDRLEN